MTPQEWSSAANKFSRANPGLTRQQIIQQMKDAGMTRPAGVKNNGFDKLRRPVFKPKSRTEEQTKRRQQHEKTSVPEAKDSLKKLRQLQQEMNNIAAAAGIESTNFEHAYPSDQAGSVISNRGMPGDYFYLNPDSDAEWKTAIEEYIRSHRDNRYRLLRDNLGDRIVDVRYADDIADPRDLPGMDVDPSMSPDEIFRTLPFTVAHLQ